MKQNDSLVGKGRILYQTGEEKVDPVSSFSLSSREAMGGTWGRNHGGAWVAQSKAYAGQAFLYSLG